MKMAWLAAKGSENPEKILHLQVLPGQPFKPYTDYPLLMVADHTAPKIEDLLEGFKQPEMQIVGSKGYATMQKLLASGWQLEKSSNCH